jgi:hypothetical protein
MTDATQRKSHARQRFLPLEEPQSAIVADAVTRDDWLQTVYTGFVQPSAANRHYYRVILETLWPVAHGIPGPYISETQLREAIDAYRLSTHIGTKPYKPYVDVFRRVRELQGEEGVIGIAKQGRIYQLVNLSLTAKRIPRTHLTDKEWKIVLEDYGNKCAVCGRRPPEVQFQQDHKIPRVRGGGDQLENWQPLCDECNNFKSTSCRGCTLDCTICSWAFPESYAPIRISGPNITRIREYAAKYNLDPHSLINEILEKYTLE